MATRFYLSATATIPVTPGFAAWTRNSEADRREMHNVKDASVMTSKTMWADAAAAANATCLNRQYVSKPMSAGIAFAIGDTVKCVLRCQESALNDNINRTPVCIKVVSEDGLTLRVTLLALLHYGPNTTEWLNTGLRTKQALDGDALTAAYTTVAGDRLVLEIGGQVSSSGGSTVTGTQSFGSDNASDFLENETQTTALNPWFEISRNITFPQTYDETGKAQVVLVVQAKTDSQSMVEAKSQVVSAVQARVDNQVAAELGKAQVILAMQAESDNVLMTENRDQVILVVQSESDVVQLNELNKAETIVVAQSESDTLVAIEALAQTILVVQSETDVYIPAGGSSRNLYAGGFANANRFDRRSWP